MSSVVKQLANQQLIRPPKHVVSGIQYETVMGSEAYSVGTNDSDIDIYGFCIPPKETVFPHLREEILGFGRQTRPFGQFQQHHINDPASGKEYDLCIYGIVKYFQLCMENNPNMIDSLFTPDRCVLYSTPAGKLVRENRKIFLHKGAWKKFKGYAFRQMHKIKTKKSNGNRKHSVKEFGYDVKNAYHIVRLVDEVEQILTEGNIDLERSREKLKAIRKGAWSVEDIEKYFLKKEKKLETLYTRSKLQAAPDEKKIRQLLFSCLEEHYGSLTGGIGLPGNTNNKAAGIY